MNFADMYPWWNQAALSNPMTAILSNDTNRDRDRFFETGKAWLAEHRAFAAAAGTTLEGSRALDFGCGIGRMTAARAEHYAEVVGIDISDEMVRLAKQLRPRANARFVQATERPLPFGDQEFNCVYSTIVVQHIPFPYNLQYLGGFFRLSRDLVLIGAPSHLRDGQQPGPGIFLLDLRYVLTCAAQNRFDLIALREFAATATRQYQYLFRRTGEAGSSGRRDPGRSFPLNDPYRALGHQRRSAGRPRLLRRAARVKRRARAPRNDGAGEPTMGRRGGLEMRSSTDFGVLGRSHSSGSVVNRSG